MTQPELPDYEVLEEETRKRHHGMMIRALFAVVVSAILTVAAVYVAVVESHMSPFTAFLFWIFGVGSSALLTIHSIFQAWRESANTHYWLKLVQLAQYQKLCEAKQTQPSVEGIERVIKK